MKKKDITNAIKNRLIDGLANTVFSMPNVDDDNKPPYIELIFGSAVRPAVCISGGAPSKETGIFTVNIHIEKGAEYGEDSANDLADEISDLFSSGQRIAFTGGQITIPKPPDIRAGVPTDTDWFVPVVISYMATSKPV